MTLNLQIIFYLPAFGFNTIFIPRLFLIFPARCMLSTAREEDGIFIGINKVVARAISSSPSIYPCPIQNRYDCPYDNKEEEEQKVTKPIIDVNQLFQLSKIAFLVELAFATAEKDRSKVQIKNRKDVFIAH